jgi:hypothetical protein
MQIPASIEETNWISCSIDEMPVKEIPPITGNEEFFDRFQPCIHGPYER